MGFIEIERTKKMIQRSGVDVIYRLNHKGIGTLRFTKRGVEKLNKVKGLDKGKTFKSYIDKDTKSVAFKQTEEGKFRLSGTGAAKGTYTLSYSDVSQEIRETTHYMIEESKDYTFILVVVKDDGEKASEAKLETEEKENKAKKGKGNKK